MKAKIISIGLVLGMMTWSACVGNLSDDDGPAGGGNAITEDKLTAHRWSVVSIESNLNEKAGEIANAIPEATLAEDGFSRPTYKAFLELKANKLEEIKACEADDLYNFDPEGPIVYSSTGSECDGSVFTSDAVFSLPADWLLSNKTLRIIAAGDTLSYTILTLDDTTLEFERRGNAQAFIDYTPETIIEVFEKYTFAAD